MGSYTNEDERLLLAKCRKNDAAVKAFLSNKAILAQIMKDCVPEYKDISPEDIANKYIEGEPQIGDEPVDRGEASPKIIGSNTEDTTEEEGTVYYDIRFLASAPSGDGLIRLIINVEAQRRDKPGYPIVKRGLYYCSRLISAQKGTEFTGSDYGNIKKVYSIWICYRPTEGKNTITRYRIRKEDEVGSVPEPENDYDLLQVIILRLGRPEPENGLSALNLLNTIFCNELSTQAKKAIVKNDYHFPMTEKLDEEMNIMCNVSYGFYEEGMEKGVEKGMEKGALRTLISLVKENLLSIKTAAAKANMTEAEFAKLMAAAE